MRGKFHCAWCLAVACSLLLFVTFGKPVFADEPTGGSSFDGLAEIEGPVHLEVTVNPPIARPRDRVTVQLTLTSRLEEPVSPTVALSLPGVLSSPLARYPAGMTVDTQRNQLSWQPVLSGSGDSEQISLEYTVTVADIRHPAQRIDVQLALGASTTNTSVEFWVGSPPSATILIDRQVVAVGEPVKLQAMAAGPGPFTQTWFLGDGRQIVANDPEVSFALPGIYEVRLQVANPLAVATALSAVTVVAQPAASFTIDDELPVAGQSVQFTNTSGGERPLQSHWFFGDGAESQEPNPTYTFATPGTYTVRLVVSSAHGQSEVTSTLSVGADPVADIVLPEQGGTGEPIQIMGFGDDSVTSLRWEMGDGRTYEGEVVTHSYMRPGAYTVTLFARNEYGETEVKRQILIEGERYIAFLPFAISSALAEGIEENGESLSALPPAEGAANVAPIEEPIDSAPQVIPEQSGSTIPTPGGAGALPTELFSQPAALPPQEALAADATPAEQLLWYVNEARRLHGLAPLTYNYQLSIAAQHHTVDMAGNPEIMHEGSDGSRPAERQQRFGYLGAYGGEAVAWGWESAVPVVEFWVNSPPHRTLILNPDADEIGVGFTADGFAPNIWYWAIEFGMLP